MPLEQGRRSSRFFAGLMYGRMRGSIRKTAANVASYWVAVAVGFAIPSYDAGLELSCSYYFGLVIFPAPVGSAGPSLTRAREWFNAS